MLLKLHFHISEREIQPSSHHGGHQEEDADAETGQGERHRPGRAGRDRQEGSRGQMQAGGNGRVEQKDMDVSAVMRKKIKSGVLFLISCENGKFNRNIVKLWIKITGKLTR